MKKIILTGFEPFGNYSHNPTQKSAEYFNGKVIGDCEILGIVLPCTYYSAYAKLLHFMKAERPSAIVSTGLSSSVHGMRIEAMFCNVMDGKYPDAKGYDPKGLSIREDSPYSLPAANCDPLALYGLLRNNDIPTEVSVNADKFICNALAYQTSAYIIENKLKTKSVFIHVPWTSDYRGRVPIEGEKMYLEKDLFYKGLELIIENI
jgi:pyroglutamyl-peptidase